MDVSLCRPTRFPEGEEPLARQLKYPSASHSGDR